MAIKDLQIRQGNVDLVLEIVDVGETREFDKFGKKGRVATAIAKDESGDIKLTLWNDDIDKVKAGDKIHLENGYVGEWQGEPQLSTGKFGKLEVVESTEAEKKEMTEPSNEEENKQAYQETEKKTEEAEKKAYGEDLKEEPVMDNEEVKD
jgi:replication factor A1